MVENICKFHENHHFIDSKSSTNSIENKFFKNVLCSNTFTYLSKITSLYMFVYISGFLIFPYANITLPWILYLHSKLWNYTEQVLNFVLHLQDYLSYSCPWHFHIHFRISLTISYDNKNISLVISWLEFFFLIYKSIWEEPTS